jgi:hypothetical protein
MADPLVMGDRSKGLLRVEIAYALSESQVLIALEVEDGATIRQAIERSGILVRIPGIDLARESVGVFGKTARLDAVLRDGDRVEIYRSLIADPRESRRRRVKRRR